jgi:hypothetical protein
VDIVPRINKLRRHPDTTAGLADAPWATNAPQLAGDFRDVTALPLKMNDELQKSRTARGSATTVRSDLSDSVGKYSCSGSPLIMAKGSTAIDGLSNLSLATATDTRGVPTIR